MVFRWFWQRWTITIECFFEGPTIGVNGFSMVFKILRAMVNDGFEVNDCLDVPLQKVRKINLRRNAHFEQNM